MQPSPARLLVACVLTTLPARADEFDQFFGPDPKKSPPKETSTSREKTTPQATAPEDTSGKKEDEDEATRFGRAEQGYGVQGRITLEEAEAKRHAWSQRGGVLLTYEVRAQGTSSFGGQGPAAYGGGYGLRFGLAAFSPPIRDRGRTTWGGGKLTVGYGWSYLGTDGVSLQIASLPFAVGAFLGIGSFHGNDKWRGLVVGAAWTPSFSSSKSGDAGSRANGQFNYAGFELTVDITTVEAVVAQLTSEAHIRFSGFVLPPLADGAPWTVQLGLGAAWY